MQVIPVPCLSDNYAYLVVQGRLAAVVDPSQADPVLRAIDEHRLKLAEIWLTHHHWDHVGGIEPLIEECPIEHVRGSRYDAEHGRIPRQTDALADGDSFDFGGARVDITESARSHAWRDRLSSRRATSSAETHSSSPVAAASSRARWR